MKGFKIKIAVPSLIMLGAMLAAGDTAALFGILLAAALHELGHITAAKLLGVKISEFSLSLLGARLNMEPRLIPYRTEIILSAAGPLVNLAAFLTFYPQTRLGGHIGEFFSYFTAASLFLCLLNLLPILSFDGGRILHSIISLFKDPDTAFKTLRILSFFCLASLWSLSVYLLLKTGNSLSLFIFSLSLFSRLFISE